MAATETVNALRERVKQKRLLLLDTDGSISNLSLSLAFTAFFFLSLFFLDLFLFFWNEFAVEGYAKSQGKAPVCFGPTDLVCCRTLQGHTGKVGFKIS